MIFKEALSQQCENYCHNMLIPFSGRPNFNIYSLFFMYPWALLRLIYPHLEIRRMQNNQVL